MCYIEGRKAEEYLENIFLKEFIEFQFIDDWYDYILYDDIKLEVKSCNLIISNGHNQIGLYNFTRKKNRQLQIKENVWVCFIIQHQDQYIIQGFCKAKDIHDLENKSKFSILKISCLKLLSIDEFIQTVVTN